MTATTLRILDIPVLGMTCARCVGRVERALTAAPGVLEASDFAAAGIDPGARAEQLAVADVVRMSNLQ